MLFGPALLAACGGGSTNFSNAPSGLEAGNATDLKAVLAAVPAGGGGGGGGSNTVRLYYNRPDGNYAGWTLYTYGGADLGGWPGKGPDGEVAGVRQVLGRPATGAVVQLHHRQGRRRHARTLQLVGQDGLRRAAVLGHRPAATRSTRSLATRPTTPSNPAGAAPPDISAVRVHYKRTDGQYTNWGVHIWASSGLDVAGLKPGVTIDQWTNAVPFTDFNNYTTDNNGIVFDIPVLNPTGDAARTNSNSSSTASRRAATRTTRTAATTTSRVNYAALKITNKVGEIWLIQGDPTVYTSLPRYAPGFDHRCPRLLAEQDAGQVPESRHHRRLQALLLGHRPDQGGQGRRRQRRLIDDYAVEHARPRR